jgi:hypothetical protein
MDAAPRQSPAYLEPVSPVPMLKKPAPIYYCGSV